MMLMTDKRFFRLAAIALAVVATVMLTACSNDDTTAVPQQEQGFFTGEVNRLIDANYPEVIANGYAKLVIPKSMCDQGRFKFPANATIDMDAMAAAGYQVYVNGGTVRDGVMGTEAHDVDFSTDATIEQIEEALPNGVKINAFADIWVVKAYHETGLETDVAPMFSIFPELSGKADVPETRFPGQPYCNDLLEDTYSRDFTFNAMYYDYVTGDIIDYHGGLHDLREGIVRTVFNADLSVGYDPRLYFRSCRFAAKYGFKMDDALDKALKENTEALKRINEDNAVYIRPSQVSMAASP